MNCRVWNIDSKNERQTHHRLNVRCQMVCHDWARFGKLIWDCSWQELNDTELWWLEQQFRCLEFCCHSSPSLQGTQHSWLSILGIYNARYWTGDKSGKLSINGRCSGKKKKITSVQVCDYVTFCLTGYKNLLSEVFPHVAQLVERSTCNAKVTGSIPGNMLIKKITYFMAVLTASFVHKKWAWTSARSLLDNEQQGDPDSHPQTIINADNPPIQMSLNIGYLPLKCNHACKCFTPHYNPSEYQRRLNHMRFFSIKNYYHIYLFCTIEYFKCLLCISDLMTCDNL